MLIPSNVLLAFRLAHNQTIHNTRTVHCLLELSTGVSLDLGTLARRLGITEGGTRTLFSRMCRDRLITTNTVSRTVFATISPEGLKAAAQFIH